MRKKKEMPKETAKEVPMEAPAEPDEHKEEMEQPKENKGGTLKTLAVIALLAIVLFLAYYFLSLPSNAFVPGSEVDVQSFSQIFLAASKVYIVMDTRGLTNNTMGGSLICMNSTSCVNSTASTNIIQCAVDFAGSNGMGGKDVSYISLSDGGCVASDNQGDKFNYTMSDCFTNLKNGITIYVRQAVGGDTAKYYSNGMVVPVGTKYTVGECSISRIG